MTEEGESSNHLPSPLLLLDAAGPLVQTALWTNGRWLAWRSSRQEAGRSLFEGVEAILAETGLKLDQIQGFLFCEGPGSMLGIRIAAMAIAGWQSLLPAPVPVYHYNSHAILTEILRARDIEPDFHVISDARRERWNILSVTDEGPAPLARKTRDELAMRKGRFFRMEETERNAPPVDCETIAYDLEHWAHLFQSPSLVRISEQAEALVQEAPEYKKWTAERHRTA